MIRIVIEDPYLRGYVCEFLKSDIGQSLMLKNAYGTNQEHLEPDVISEILIPVPKDEATIKRIGAKVLESIEELESYVAATSEAKDMLNKTAIEKANMI